MDHQSFENLFEEVVDQCRTVLVTKAAEYATDDRLHNFKQAAKMERSTPELALRGMLTKHLVSVYDMIEDTRTGKTHSMAKWDEKLGDALNYLILLKALVVERDLESRRNNMKHAVSPTPMSTAAQTTVNRISEGTH